MGNGHTQTPTQEYVRISAKDYNALLQLAQKYNELVQKYNELNALQQQTMQLLRTEQEELRTARDKIEHLRSLMRTTPQPITQPTAHSKTQTHASDASVVSQTPTPPPSRREGAVLSGALDAHTPVVSGTRSTNNTNNENVIDVNVPNATYAPNQNDVAQRERARARDKTSDSPAAVTEDTFTEQRKVPTKEEIQSAVLAHVEQVRGSGVMDVEPEQILAAIMTGRNKKLLAEIKEDQARKTTMIERAKKENPDVVFGMPALAREELRYAEVFEAALLMYKQVHGKDFERTDRLLTSERVEIICHNIERGMRRSSAFAAVGVRRPTQGLWQRLAEKGTEPYAALFDLIEMAEARLESLTVANWQRHTVTDWQAARAFLERRFPQDWGNKSQQSISLDDLRKMSDETLAQIVSTRITGGVNELEATFSTGDEVSEDEYEQLTG